MSNMYLNPNLYKTEVVHEPIRAGFGRGLVEAGRLNKNVVALCADLTDSTKMDAFAKEFPDRFIEVGVAEQNLVTVAAGMAGMGQIPFGLGFCPFWSGRKRGPNSPPISPYDSNG